MARIFIVGDTGQTWLLDDVADTLRHEGHEVVRGPVNRPGEVSHYSANERAALIDDADIAVFTIRHACTHELMAAAPRLRGVCYPTIGVETLDLAAASELGVIVGHGAVRGNIIGMAEATIMLVLMLLYGVETNIARARNGQWRPPRHSGRQLEGKTVGLLGYGRIAQEMTIRLRPFGARLIATPSPRSWEKPLPPDVEKVGLARLLAESDVLCLLTGLTPETRGMIGGAQLAALKPGAVLVNTGRGEVVDEAVLAALLADNTVAGAALDTFTIEPLPADSRLRALDNVILTPHCVGHTVEGEAEFGPALIANIQCILRGDLPPHCKNPEAEPAWRQRLAKIDALSDRPLLDSRTISTVTSRAERQP